MSSGDRVQSGIEVILRVLLAECYLRSWAIGVDDRQMSDCRDSAE